QTPGYHNPYRWGMTVDVDRCTGCSACAAACYAENNVPVVGKERADLGREMSWLRVERYLEGEGDSYMTLMQPMFCQHCGNAGCEPVCPVYATYHNPDGLNAQIYNRCVGTRYCSNNCGYKVRRFNWFNYEAPAPLHLQLNPDVTVRSKGVMEKCTFCVQRIQRAKMAAHNEGRELKDGEVTPACVQTCASKALTFGNLADPNSAVSKKAMRNAKKEQRVRQYEVLEELRQDPGVTYLRKVTLTQKQEA
ncbi:MAG TPA: 4Fe-4S dicluster domain-containing protein, partial [bacterium]